MPSDFSGDSYADRLVQHHQLLAAQNDGNDDDTRVLDNESTMTLARQHKDSVTMRWFRAFMSSRTFGPRQLACAMFAMSFWQPTVGHCRHRYTHWILVALCYSYPYMGHFGSVVA